MQIVYYRYSLLYIQTHLRSYALINQHSHHGDLIQSQLNELKEKFESLESSIQHKSSPAKLKAERKYYSTLTPFSLRFNKNEDEL